LKPETKRPGSFRSPGLCEQSLEGALLSASLSRMHSVLFSIKLGCPRHARPAQRIGPMQGGATSAWRLHRRHHSCRRESDSTRHGSVRSDSAERFHDEASESKTGPDRATGADCKESLPPRQPPARMASKSLRRQDNPCRTSLSPEDKTRWRCSRSTRNGSWPAARRQRVSNRPSPRSCRSHRACGARSSHRDRSATGWRGRSKRTARRRKAGSIRNERPLHSPTRRKRFSRWHFKPGAARMPLDAGN
jgi:hypothetical protein